MLEVYAMSETCLVVDGNSLLYRAFHALPPMDADGVPTNAVHGFLLMLLKAFEDYHPEYCAVCFDEKGPTFRHTEYAEYKAGRAPMPDELRPQFPLIKEILSAMSIGVLSLMGYEADDLLGTISLKCEEKGIRCLLLTGDRDALQLVDHNTSLLFTRKGISEITLFGPDEVKDYFGVTPEQVTDWKGLMGDSSDNIPGIPGVGEKTAVKLLKEYGTLERVLDNADDIKGKLGEKVRASKDLALFSKKLATIHRKAPVDCAFSSWAVTRLYGALPLIQRYHLSTVADKVQRIAGAAPKPAAAREETVWQTVSDADALKKALASLAKDAYALFINDAALTIRQGALCIRAEFGPAQQSLLDVAAGFAMEEAVRAIAPYLDRPLITHHAKSLLHLLNRLGLPLPEIEWDTMVAAYLLNPQEKSYALQAFGEASAAGVFALYLTQKEKLEQNGMTALYQTIEKPLTTVLFAMEKEGFQVDGAVLRSLGEEFSAISDGLQKEIIDLLGVGDFNINSPQQLGKVLFEMLGLPARKKTTRGYSTDAATLEALEDHHPAIPKLLQYRQVTKLSSTYIDPMLRNMDKEGRIHTTFDQTGTATGRISSNDPNLQNIPVRTTMGREIRRAFVAKKGCVLVDGDYSQIELRILAHMSGDEAMRDAFIKGQDIHLRTAAEVNGVPMEDVTPSMRAAAKAVNFGIVYGISDFGLARNIGISRREAADFIDRYLRHYPGVRDFMEKAKQDGYQKGYAETLYGRRRWLTELQARNANLRAFGERAAMNTPIQGTAADIIKAAMVKVYEELMPYQARLILQVHDELIVECPAHEQEEIALLLRRCMENVLPLSVPLVADVHIGENWYESK